MNTITTIGLDIAKNSFAVYQKRGRYPLFPAGAPAGKSVTVHYLI